MSVESKLGKTVLDLSEVIKSNVITAMARARSQGDVSMTQDDLATLAEVVGAEIDKAVMGSVGNILSVVKS